MNITNPLRNASGCMDLTAYQALKNVGKNGIPSRRDRKRRSNKKYPRVYICSPFADDKKINARKAVYYCRYALGQKKFPIAPHIWFPRFMDDDNIFERELAMKCSLWLISQCSEVWVFGDRITGGMAAEIKTAKECKKTVRYFEADVGMED